MTRKIRKIGRSHTVPLPIAQTSEFIHDMNTGEVYIGYNGENLAVSNTGTLQTQITALSASQLAATEVSATALPNKVVRRDGSSKVTGDITGNAATATKLATARTVSLTGGVTATGSFDGSGDLALAATVDADAHYHYLKDLLDCPTTFNGQDGFYLRVDGTRIILDEAHGIHNSFTDRGATDCHPITAITGLETLVEMAGAPLGNPTVDGQVLSSDTDGNRTWVDIVQNATHTGDVTGRTELTIANNAVTFGKMQTIATGVFLGRSTAGNGSIETITFNDAITIFGAENYLGLPSSTGMLLSSTTAGVRSWVTAADSGAAEPVLGNPAADGYVLSSTAAGVRSWIEAPNGLPEGGTEGQVLGLVSSVPTWIDGGLVETDYGAITDVATTATDYGGIV